MIIFKKLISIGVAIAVLGGISVTAFAGAHHRGMAGGSFGGNMSNAEIASKATDRTIESVITEKNITNKTYGTIANEAGKLQEFKDERLQSIKDQLDTQVSEKLITQEKADLILGAMEKNQLICDGSGNNGTCLLHDEDCSFLGLCNVHGTACTFDGACVQTGVGCGQGLGYGQGQGLGHGQGHGMGHGGQGRGVGMNRGLCIQ